MKNTASATEAPGLAHLLSRFLFIFFPTFLIVNMKSKSFKSETHFSSHKQRQMCENHYKNKHVAVGVYLMGTEAVVRDACGSYVQMYFLTQAPQAAHVHTAADNSVLFHCTCQVNLVGVI